MGKIIDKSQLTKMNTAIVEVLFCGMSAQEKRAELNLLPAASQPNAAMQATELSDTEKADLINGIVMFLQENSSQPLTPRFINRFAVQCFSRLPEAAMSSRLEAFNAYLLDVFTCKFSGEDIEGNEMDLETALVVDFMRIKKKVGRAYLEESNLLEREERDKVIYIVVTEMIQEMLDYVDDLELQGNILKMIKSLDKGGHLEVNHTLLHTLDDEKKEQLQDLFDALYSFQYGDLEKSGMIIMPGEESLAYSLTRDVVSRWMLF